MRASAHTGVAIPPLRGTRYRLPPKIAGVPIFWCFSVHIPSNRGIATTSLRTGLAMTGNWESARQTTIQVIGFSKLVVKMVFVGFVPSIVGRGYDPAAHVPRREMYVLPGNPIAQVRQVGGGVITPPYRASAINAEFTSVLTKADNLNNNLSYCCVNPISTFRRPNSVFWALPKPNNRQKTGANSGNQSFPELAPVCFQEALDHSARAGSERFFLSRRFRKRRNPVWISRFWNRTDGGKDPLPSRSRIIQRFLYFWGL